MAKLNGMESIVVHINDENTLNSVVIFHSGMETINPESFFSIHKECLKHQWAYNCRDLGFR